MAVLSDRDAQNFKGSIRLPYFYNLYYKIELGSVLQLREITSCHPFNFQKKKCKSNLT